MTDTSETRSRIAGAVHGMKRRRSMTVAQIAERAGFPAETVSAWLRGRRDIPSGKLDTLCAAMDCTVAQLLALAASTDC